MEKENTHFISFGQYQHGSLNVRTGTYKNTPTHPLPGMRANDLTYPIAVGNVKLMGLSEDHLWPSDVITLGIKKEEKEAIDSFLETCEYEDYEDELVIHILSCYVANTANIAKYFPKIKENAAAAVVVVANFIIEKSASKNFINEAMKFLKKNPSEGYKFLGYKGYTSVRSIGLLPVLAALKASSGHRGDYATAIEEIIGINLNALMECDSMTIRKATLVALHFLSAIRLICSNFQSDINFCTNRR